MKRTNILKPHKLENVLDIDYSAWSGQEITDLLIALHKTPRHSLCSEAISLSSKIVLANSMPISFNKSTEYVMVV